MSTSADAAAKKAAGCKTEGQKMDNVEEELKQFDFVQAVLPDIHGIPRGRLVPSDVLPEACRNGVGMYAGIQCMGPHMELSLEMKEFELFPNGKMCPLAGTVRPLAWSSSPNRRIGHVMCQMQNRDGVSESCPRLVAQRQVERLEKKGFRIKSAFECEFTLLKTDTMEPLGGEANPFANLDLMDRQLDLVTDMLHMLRESGVKTEYFHPEYQGGQYEASMQPQFGIDGADDAFMFRYGVRAFCYRRGLTATFMAIPYSHYHSAGFHLNHSLWSQDDRNVLHEASDPQKLSPIARHWIAGLLEHAPALTALSCPTFNCYHRLGVGFAPGTIYWNMEDRLTTFRVKTTDGNVFLENRIPSSACNPYLALAATIAAGLDGIERKLQCPSPGPPGEGSARLPATLEEALEALEKDVVLKEALGPKLVDYFVIIKREIELKHFEQVITKGMSDAEKVAKEREYYMPFI